MQLRFVEADHLGSIVLQEIVDDLLFGLGVQTTDIEGDQFKLLPVGPCIGSFPVDVVSLHWAAYSSDFLCLWVGSPTHSAAFAGSPSAGSESPASLAALLSLACSSLQFASPSLQLQVPG